MAASAAAVGILRGGALPLIMLSSCKTKTTWSLHSPRTFSKAIVTLFGSKTTSTSSRTRRRSFFFRASLEAAEASSITTAANDATLPSSSSISPSDSDSDSIMDAANNALDLRVGRILRAWQHPEADGLYVEEVDVGEPEPRTICSGLVKFIPLHQLQDVKVVVLANLKPRNMRGVNSNGMLLAASDVSHENVELLLPPEGSVPGERIWFGSGEEREHQSAAATPNQVQKKKIWELVQPHLKTDDCCVAVLGVHPMLTSAGVVVCKSLQNANIS